MEIMEFKKCEICGKDDVETRVVCSTLGAFSQRVCAVCELAFAEEKLMLESGIGLTREHSYYDKDTDRYISFISNAPVEILYKGKIYKNRSEVVNTIKNPPEKKIFYRVEGIDGYKGLWYDKDGKFSNRISKVYPPCKNGELPMPYDEKVIGYLSCVEKLEDLYYWFSAEDLISMKKHGFALKKFESTDYRFYDNHWLMSTDSKVIEIIE